MNLAKLNTAHDLLNLRKVFLDAKEEVNNGFVLSVGNRRLDFNYPFHDKLAKQVVALIDKEVESLEIILKEM